MNSLKYWLALNQAPYIGPVNFKLLCDTFGNPKNVFQNIDDISSRAKLRQKTLSYLKSPNWNAIENELKWADDKKNHIITLDSPEYPVLLKEIADTPPVLYVHGDISILNTPQIAIVGSRNPSNSGQDNAFNFASFLAAQGITVTSGLAIGIDSSAHRGALKSGTTISVVATGLDRVYPARNKQLAHEIAGHGALVSENPLGTPPKKEHFPRRNRIISGMTIGTLVIEAAQQSGSLITARLAGEQGREVFAIPGSIHNPLAKGCHALIREGAKLVETADHILEEIGQFSIAPVESQELCPHKHNKEEQILDSKEEELLNNLGFEPTAIDTVVQRSRLTPEAVSSMLLVLELQGYVEAHHGGTYSRIK